MPGLETETPQDKGKKEAANIIEISINAWPTICDAIKWSEDGDIAIACADDLHLLLPKLRVVEDAPEHLWEPMRFRVTTFAPTEIYQAAPMAARSYSMGEEISISDVVSLQWTPAGIAKHGRCALFILTQNLLLSVWAPASSARSLKDWDRRVIVNNELRDFFEELYPSEKQREDGTRPDKLRELIRVRAFVLSEALHLDKTFNGQPLVLLATSNDNNQVVISKCSPSSDDGGGIDISPFAHFSPAGDPPPNPSLHWTFEDYMNRPRHVSHLAWSSWTASSVTSSVSLLACATHSAIVFRRVRVERGAATGRQIFLEPFSGRVELRNPLTSDAALKWLPTSPDGRTERLLICGRNRITLVLVDTLFSSTRASKAYVREDWSQLVGPLVLESSKSIAIASHSTLSDDGSLMTLSWDELTPSPQPMLEISKMIRDGKISFGDTPARGKHGVCTRMYGLATSPFEDMVAAIISYHPSDSPEYIIPADMMSTLLLHCNSRLDYLRQAIEKGSSAEAVVLTTKLLLKERTTAVEKKELAFKLLDQIEAAVAQPGLRKPDPEESSFKDILFSSPVLIRLRYEYALSIMLGDAVHNDTAEEVGTQLTEQLVRVILSIPEKRFTATKASRLTLAHQQRLLARMHLGPELMESEAEECQICTAEIPFEESGFARCYGGHKFRRCDLTMLAIQAPGISRCCGICNKQYLLAISAEVQDIANGDAEVELETPSLTKSLLEACNRCVFCGGKFVG